MELNLAVYEYKNQIKNILRIWFGFMMYQPL